MIYLIQATFYTAILYMVYLLFLKNRSDHHWSRAYLLLNMILPFVLPLISLPIFERNNVAISEVVLPVITIGTQVSEQAKQINVLPIIYIGISSVLLGYFIAQAFQIMRFIKRNPSERTGKIRLIRSTGMGPGSWFNYVFIPDTEANDAVLKHEEAHVQYKHSCDIVFIRLLQCIAWPNVLLFLIMKELRTVHEFQADAVAAKDKETYNTTLLNELFYTKHFSLSHTFFHHPIKRRIMMLQKNKSHAGKMKVVTLSMLLMTGMLYIQCTKEVSARTTTTQPEEQKMDATGVYKVVDKMPRFYYTSDLPGFLMQNIRYPEAAKTNKIGGRVVVKFIVDEEGKVTNAQVLESPDKSLSESALAAVNKMPVWIPGEKDGKKVKVYFTLPISFVPEMPTELDKKMKKAFLMDANSLNNGQANNDGITRIYPFYDGC